MTAPHGDKLRALLNNAKIPEGDKARVAAQVVIYDAWIDTMDDLQSEGDALLTDLVECLNSYKKTVEFDLIFCSESDFLYRQKGQLKLDNTILEEFLPRLFDQRLINGLVRYEGLECGPKKSFSGLSFDNPVMALSEGGANLKTKNQDFSITRKHNMVISQSDKPADRFSEDFHVSYFASEIKTNLDKTMFQEGAATAAELKKSTTGSRYILLCEWLDMKPISTKLTAIDEVIILRRSKRIGSDIRSNFSTAQGRAECRDWFERFLDDHPLCIESFKRFVFHLNECFPDADHDAEDIVLGRGFF
jgi:hypothetical protein